MTIQSIKRTLTFIIPQYEWLLNTSEVAFIKKRGVGYNYEQEI